MTIEHLNFTDLPNGTVTATLRSPGGKILKASIDCAEAFEVEGDGVLRKNQSLVTTMKRLLAAHNDADNKQLNSTERVEAQQRGQDLAATANYLADLSDQLSGKSTQAWCSHCGQYATHRHVHRGAFHANAYLCAHCGMATTNCFAIGCSAKAVRPHGPRNIANYCAEHRHEVRAFGRTQPPLENIANYRDQPGYSKVNKAQLNQQLVSIITLAGIGLGGGIMAAPAVGRTIGVRRYGLSGTAATRAGLEALGNWAKLGRVLRRNALHRLNRSAQVRGLPQIPMLTHFPDLERLAASFPAVLDKIPTVHCPQWLRRALTPVGRLFTAENLSIARGSAIVVALGGALGAFYGTHFLSGYIREDKSFDIQKTREGSGPNVILVQGFTSEKRKEWGREERFALQLYDDPSIYRVMWGAQNVPRLGMYLSRFPTTYVGSWQLKKLVEVATTATGFSIGSLGTLSVGSSVLNNPWHVAVSRAARGGKKLADILLQSDQDGWVMVANSLGARVLVDTAMELGSKGAANKLSELHLLGAAVNRSGYGVVAEGPGKLTAAVSGAIHNYHSRNDQVLHWLYPITQLGKAAAGYTGFDSTDPKVRNHDVTDQVGSHFSYFNVFNRYLSQLD